MFTIVQQIELEQMAGKKIPNFKAGDTVVVKITVQEGDRKRLQTYEGIVIAKRNRGLNSSFTVRKISHDKEGVERVFQTYSPQIHSITLKRQGVVRRAKLNYLRKYLSGSKARIREKLPTSKKASLKSQAKTSHTDQEISADTASTEQAKTDTTTAA